MALKLLDRWLMLWVELTSEKRAGTELIILGKRARLRVTAMVIIAEPIDSELGEIEGWLN